MQTDFIFFILFCKKNKMQAQTNLIIKPSSKPNAGNGVFTTQPIKKGEFVCYYEGYKAPTKPTPLEVTYLFGNIVGFMKPRSTLGVAQILNDSGKMDLSLLNESSSLEDQIRQTIQQLLKYLTSYWNCNVGDNNTIVERKTTITSEFVATKDIEAGSELFFHYGFKYWLHLNEFSGSFDRYRVVTAVQALMDMALHDNEEAFLHCYEKYAADDIRGINNFHQQSLTFIASTTTVSNYLINTKEMETAFLNRKGTMKVDLSKMDRKPRFTKEMIDSSYQEFKDQLKKDTK
jgi:hypothetical protein